MKCVVCTEEVAETGNWIKMKVWGGFGIFHWQCFGRFLRAGTDATVEEAVWKARAY